MAISEINDKSLAASAVNLATTTVTGILPVANTVANLSPGNNLVINGDMQVAQRGADINSVANGGFCTDRFKISYANTDNLVLNLDQSTDTPAGFSSSLKLSVGTVESALAADEYLQFGQKIEAQNLQQLIYGTSSAKTLTLSFWVKSSATGTYAVSIFQSDATKYYSTTYTINSANTWEYKTVEINGNVSNVINNDNGEGLRVNWTLSAGTNYTSGSNGAWGAITNWSVGHNVSWITTSGATFFITGVQLEVGTVATPFNHRSFGEELSLCQRYFYKKERLSYPGATIGVATAGTNLVAGVDFPVTMRGTPSLVIYDRAGTTNSMINVGNNTVFGFTPSQVWWTEYGIASFTGSNSFTANSVQYGYNFKADAEL